MPDLKTLYLKPLDTARQFAIVISGLGGDAREKTTDFEHDLKFNQVRSGTAMYAAGFDEPGCLRVEVRQVGQVKAYFLPWSKREIYRIRPKQSTNDGMAENLFFTPNLDGCMVTIEGTADAPTIYHANSSGAHFDTDEDIRDPVVETKLKIAKMKENLEVFAQMQRKKAVVAKQPVSPVAHFDLNEYDMGSTQNISQNPLDSAWMDIQQSFCYGAVFGVRKQGNWTFYKQSYRCIRRKYKDDGRWIKFGKPGKNDLEIIEKVDYQVLGAAQLWP